MNNIVLIGMPGSGKSTIGVVLAKALGYHFIDSDILIQEKYNKTLSEIIDERGEKEFIKIEEEVNKSIDVDRTIIATGGSVVYGPQAMKHLKEIGMLLYLNVSERELDERLGDLAERGVISNGKNSVEEIYEDRINLYKQYADVTIDEDNKSIREIVLEIKSRLMKEEYINYML